MKFLEAAEEVLRSEGRPLTAREITDMALRRGLLKTQGKTPDASMSAVLYAASNDSPIRRKYRKGKHRAVRDSVRWVYVERSRSRS